MRGTQRRTTLWVLAVVLLAGPAASMTGLAAECAGRRAGRDGWTRIAKPDFPDPAFSDVGLTGHVVLPSKVSIFVVTNGYEVMRSVDAGCTWSQSELGADSDAVSIGGYDEILELDTSSFSVRSKRVYLVARGSVVPDYNFGINDTEPTAAPRVYVSSDEGASFQLRTTGLPLIGVPGRLRVADGVDNVAYVVITDPIQGGESLYVTRDWGGSWVKTTGQTILPTANGSIVDFAIDPGRPDQVWAWDQSDLFRSTDAGRTFRPVPEVTDPVSTIEFTPKGIGRISDVRVYHAGSASADFSPAPQVSWTREKAPGNIASSTSVPYAGVRVLASAQQVFSFFPNIRTQTITGPIDISPVGVDPIDVEGAYTVASRDVTVVGRTTSHLMQRDPRLPPPPLPPLPPIGALGECRPEPLGDKAFRASAREIVLRPGERRRVGYDLNLPPVPSDLDVNFMLDTTGSMAGVIAGLREDIKGIVDNICAQGVPVQFGLADFREYPGPWAGAGSVGGGPNACQYPYKRRLPISPVGPDLRAAIGDLDTGCGATDGSDSALEAMFQAATGKGRKDPVTTQQLIPRGLSAEFRPASLKVIVVAIDTSWRDATPGYPGPSFETVARELRLRGIKVVGLAIGERPATGHLRTNKEQLSDMAAATKTLAPAGGTDCDADGAIDVGEGEPLVCVLHSPGRDAVELGPAMSGLLAALEDRSSIGIELLADPSVLAPGGTQQRDDVDVKKPNRLAFDNYFVCDSAGYGRTFPVTVNATSRGRILATTEVTVRCGVPQPDPVRIFIAPVVAAAVPAPPPPPAPVTVTQLQPNPNPNPQVNPQAQPQPNLGVVGQEQEQLDVALATVDLEDENEPGSELAMSGLQQEDSTVQVAAVLVGVGLTAGAAYGLALRRRPEVVPVRVTRD